MSVLITALLFGPVCGDARAQIGNHYPLGAEGINCATLPPEGFFLKDYNLFYHSSSLRGADGTAVPGNNRALVYVNAPRMFYFPGWKILGADAGVDLTVPFVHTDLTLGGTKFSKAGLGDVLGEFLLGWHGDRYHLAAAFGLWAPTGEFLATEPASPGKGFWTPMIPLGLTLYLDKEKTWNFSTAHRLEFSGEQDQTGITPGKRWSSEWSVTKTLKPGLDLGVVGYGTFQYTDDTSPGNTAHDRAFGVGPELDWFWAKHKLHFAARYYREFAVRDRFRGGTALFVITKIW